MKYIVLDTGNEFKINNIPDTAYLIKDQWDDWFRYSTMYDLYIINKGCERKKIGKIKIGQKGMEENQRRANIPLEFENLDDIFFSLGQSDYYYENLKELGDEYREEILSDLNDIAKNEIIYNQCINEDVTLTSLLRDISSKTVTNQFRRIANGGARLTEFNFTYKAPKIEHSDLDGMELEFYIEPESTPPTNIHVIIGRNGVGKTNLITNMVKTVVTNNEENGSFISDDYSRDIFSKVIFLSFSAFDIPNDIEKIKNKKVPYLRIGLPEDNKEAKLENIFAESIATCLKGIKKQLLLRSIEILSSDPIFNQSNIVELCKNSKLDKLEDIEEFKKISKKIFKKLSSGHKIIILTVAQLIQTVEEKTLVFLDEPEGHLHPPLLSSFIRALSELLINRNGVAIIATHSPVILQEVPKSCVWKLRRNGRDAIAERLRIESFGENIALLIEEVFGLEVTHSGYHNMLVQAVEKYNDYNVIVKKFKGQLGSEAKAILKTLISIREQEGDSDE